MRRLTIIPCSAKKRRTGYQDSGPRLTDVLAPETGGQLVDARSQVKDAARVDEATLMPAWMRYQGSLYEAGNEGLETGLRNGEHILIISGGYGLVMAEEPIGWYEAVLKPSWWPRGLLERCILEYASHHGLTEVTCFAGAKTPYAQVLRRVSWRRSGLTRARLLSPDLRGEGGAMRKGPEAQGEALRAHFSDGLDDNWKSSKGFDLAEEVFL